MPWRDKLRLLRLAVRSGVQSLVVSVLSPQGQLLRRSTTVWTCNICNHTGPGTAVDFHRHYVMNHYETRTKHAQAKQADGGAGTGTRQPAVREVRKR